MLRKAYLEITNVCNLACSFCPGTKREKRFMSEEEFRTLAGKLRPHTDYIYFHLMGEPLLHPQLKEFLAIAGELGFKVIITTNGTLLEKKADILLEAAALHKVNISLQSFEANTVGDFESYVNLCADFAARAAEKGKIAVLRLWNEGGLDKLNGEIEKILLEHFPGEWKESRGGLKLSERIWLEHGEKFDWPELSAQDMGQQLFCYGLRDQIGVLCDGTVVPCCLDHDGDIALGNLFDDSLKDIMSTERTRNIYEGFSKRQAVEELCRKCGYARRFT